MGNIAASPTRKSNTGLVWAVGLVLLCVLLVPSPAVSSDVESPFIVKSWSQDDGLPGNSVIAITQTRDGYLWLGTIYGLARFDGIQFTVFDRNTTPELQSSTIVHLFEDSRSNLWVGTETGGVLLITNGEIRNLNLGQGSRNRRLVSSCEDSQGAVWLYTADGQLTRYRDDELAFWNDAAAGIPSQCRSLIHDASGLLWVGMDWHLFGSRPAEIVSGQPLPVAVSSPVGKLDYLLSSASGGYWQLADGRVQKWNGDRLERDWGPYPWNPDSQVSAACEDLEGNLIVGTLNVNDGVYWLGPDGNASHISSAQGLSHDGILSLCVDREGDLWVGTDGGGLHRIRRSRFSTASGTDSWVVQSVAEDNEGGLWIGCNGGEVGYLRNGLLREFATSRGADRPSIRSVLVDRDQRVWIGTVNGGLYQRIGSEFRQVAGPGVINPVVVAIHQDRDGRLWLGTRNGLVHWQDGQPRFVTTRDGLSSDSIRAIADDTEGNLWVGTEGGGLNRLRDGTVTVYRKDDQGLPSDDVSSLWMDDEGVLWIGTGGGLARFHREKWTRYTIEDGLISNNIGYLTEDKQGYLWIGSNRGLMRVEKKALNDFAESRIDSVPCRDYGKPDGLPTRECTTGSQPGSCQTQDGRLWFPTIRGLVTTDPAELQSNPFPPPVAIEAVLVDGQRRNTNALRSTPPTEVTVQPEEERVEIHYTSLSLAAPDRSRFRYRMRGHEADWTEAGDRRVAPYSKLPPGEYEFQVTASNEDGVWNETGQSLAVIVVPPFWRTLWFTSISAFCLLAAIVALVHYISTQRLQRQVERMRQREALERERARIARDLHDELGANLTQVALLGELANADKAQPEEVQSHAQQISQTARDTTRALDEIVWAANPSNDTLEGLVNYICKYAQEYCPLAGLRYRLDVPKELPETTVPPDLRHNVFLAVKEALNNVIKHAQATEARLRLRLERDHFIIEIEDDGMGPAQTESDRAKTRNGLRNMRQRMNDIGGSFQIGPAGKRGTLVRLTAPLKGM